MTQFLTAALLAEGSVGTPDAGATALGALASGPAARTAGGAALRVLDIVTGRVTSALTNTTTTLADMTGLGLPVVAGGTYLYEFSGTYSSSATGCYIAAALNGPAAGTSGVICNLHLHVGVGADTWHNGCTTAFAASNTPAYVAAANAVTPWRLYGSFEVGATGGTVVPQFARNAGAGTITIQAGAWGWLLRIA
ncbi:hypothetical protein ACLQ2R_17325 [Streptosporangium sp. DT93]|uniref:hypothetical protein n=1 Tax=Streptosporangium sp. DT93 TaxID=3393428 RepID=UPI003CF1A550